VKKFTTVPEDVKQQSQKKRIDLELARTRLVRPIRALLAASSHLCGYFTTCFC
jgi:hypothetical protein